MPDITLTAEPRPATGSGPARRLRAAGRIPAVVYGRGSDPQAVAVDARELRAALTTESGVNALITLQVDGAEHLTMARVLQRDPIRHTVTHVDFQIVRRDEQITADVQVVLVGEAEQVRSGDGVVDHQLTSLTIQATPLTIPNQIEVDISGLELGGAIRVGDLNLPAGVTTSVDPEEPVVVGSLPTRETVDEEVEEVAAGVAAEAEEGEPLAPEASAEGDAGGAEGEGAGGESEG